MPADPDVFETHRPALLALAYRMLGDLSRAEDVVQDAWLRWDRADVEVDTPKTFLLTTVARLCLDDLGSARARREENRSDRLPEPIDLDDGGLARFETLDQVSMAFLVLLQRLTPTERAVFLLHDVFDMDHLEIAALLGKSDSACRQVLERARDHVAAERRAFQTSHDEQRRLLLAFIHAVSTGDASSLTALLAEDAMLIVDPGPNPTSFGRLRRIGKPVVGRARVAAVIEAFSAQDDATRLTFVERALNGQPAMVALLDGRILAVAFLSVADGRIRHLFFQGDPQRLRHISPPDPSTSRDPSSS